MRWWLARGGKISDDQGAALIRAWVRLRVDRLPMAPLLFRVELRSNFSAHDALFVAAAEAHGVALVTPTARLASASGRDVPSGD